MDAMEAKALRKLMLNLRRSEDLTKQRFGQYEARIAELERKLAKEKARRVAAEARLGDGKAEPITDQSGC